jgi:hypothetical protein
VIATLLTTTHNLTTAPNRGLGDPLFFTGLHWGDLLVLVVRVLVAFVVLLVATALMIWFERKVISDMQSRIGPSSKHWPTAPS